MKLSSLTLATLCVLFVASNALFGQQTNSNRMVIQNVRIFDVESGTLPNKKQSILIIGNRIAQIADSIEGNETNRIDLDGQIVLPGLIDLHTHLLLHPYNEATWNEQVLNESLGLRTIRATVAARRTLEYGFTTIRELGTEGAGFADVALRDAINQDIIVGPRIFTATKALVTTGGYGPMGFDPRWQLPVGAQTADGVAECRRATREQIAAGADWIKIYADYRRRSGDPSTPTFSQEELDAIVDEATSAGVPVAAHSTTDGGIRRCVNAGVKTIEHGYAASKETLLLMKEKGVVLCPTLAASHAISGYQGWNGSGPDPDRIAIAKRLIVNAVDAGVTIACGSDAGVFKHGENARELELMFAYGVPAADVIRSATVVAAKVLKQEDLGVVKPGMLADLIFVDQDPLQNISVLREPGIVMKNGVVEYTTNEHSGDNFNSSNAAGLQEQLSNLDLNNPGMQIIELNQSSSESGDADASSFSFEMQKDGSFKVGGQTVSRGELARTLAKQIEKGMSKFVVLVAADHDNASLVATQKWLKQLGLDSIRFETKK